MDKVIVKHSLLPYWIACREVSERLKKPGSEHMKSKIAKQGLQIRSLLYNVNFTHTYVDFTHECIEMLGLFYRYTTGIDECIKLATLNYFEKYYKNDKLKLDLFPKSHTGAQGGFICKIQGAEEFFVKNHTFITSCESQHSLPDRRKIFVYRLLHLIGVGAEPHFISSWYSQFRTSTLAFHIATKRVLGFKRRVDRSSCQFTSHHQLQLDVLERLLYLTNLNSGNYGLDEKEQLFVIDFMIIPEDCIHYDSEMNNFMKSDQQEECKEIITDWNLLENLNEAKNLSRTDFSRLGSIDWKDGYEMYLEAVAKNIDLMMTVF